MKLEQTGEGASTGGQEPTLVVAIGGSAGALDAYEQFFRLVPAASRAAFMVVQHLDPTHPSLLPELLGRMTPLPVRAAADGTRLESGAVYHAEPGKAVRIVDGVFRTTSLLESPDRYRPIDVLFESLAGLGRRGVAVIMSGNGSDGARGLQAVRSAGGRAVVQDPESARYDGMPRSAIATGSAEAVLSPDKLASFVVQLLREADGEGLDEVERALRPLLAELCAVVRERTGHDFSAYKKPTLLRRIERRMHDLHVDRPTDYLRRLREDGAEPNALRDELLIGVTRFFRDEEAFAALAQVVVPAVFQRPGEEAVRIWVPACSTGEEAYSIAMLFREHAQAHGISRPVQIFATDADASAVEIARHGRYSEAVAEQLGPERLNRHFVRERAGYRVHEELRETVIFSQHDLLRDPPFSRMDLVSCRNLFIYFEPEVQARLLPNLHYALLPGGYLLLGPAEGVAGAQELFTVVDKRQRLFQRREAAVRPALALPTRSTPRVDVRHEGLELALPATGEITRLLASELLETHAPPAVVVDERGSVLFFSGRTGKFLEPRTGAPTNHLLDLVHRELRAQTHAVVQRAVQEDRRAEARVELSRDGKTGAVLLVAQRLVWNEQLRTILVVFRELEPPREVPPASAPPSPDAAVRQLEAELHDTREHLQQTIEQVKASNEELLSMNEELQSANEELQTSKEEFQSLNEELETVNAELSRKLEELDQASSDLQNFFENTRVPALFLDEKLRIQKFTPATERLFRLIPSDVGRPFSDLVTTLEAEGLAADFRTVLRTLAPVERELATVNGGAHFLMRVNPYRTVANVIKGVVVTFTDVTELKKSQEREAVLAAIVESSNDAIVGHQLDGTITSWNAGAESLYWYRAREALGKPVSMLVPPEERAAFAELQQKVRSGEAVSGLTTQRLRRDGTRVDVSLTVSPIRDRLGELVGFSSISRDITQERRAAVERARLAAIVESSDDAIIGKDLNGIITSWNASAERLFGYTAEEMVGTPIYRIVPSDHTDDVGRILGAIRRGEKVKHYDTVRVTRDGRRIHVSLSVSPVRDETGRIIGASKIARDISERVHAEESLKRSVRLRDDFISIASHELKTPLTSLKLHADGMQRLFERPDAPMPEPERIRRFVLKTTQQLDRMQRLIDEMLDVSRIGVKGLALQRQAMDLTALVDETLARLQPNVAEANCRLELDLQPHVTGQWDPTRLEQVVTNLVTNACRYAPGTPIRVKLASDGEWAVFEVRDEGPGIPPRDHERIFERFERASGTAPAGGFGVGLYIVREIVRSHGGDVVVRSIPGEGATFVIRLPRRTPGAPPAP